MKALIFDENELNKKAISLLKELEFKNFINKNLKDLYEGLTPEQKNSLQGLHGSFHYLIVKFLQEEIGISCRE